MKANAKFLALVLAAALLSGCSWFSFFSDAPQTPQIFTDLPVPPELEVDDDDTKIYEGLGGRVGRLLARGRIDQVAIINYYRENMRQNGWTIEGEFDGEDRYTMVFVKKPRSAAINVTGGWIYTDVEINVSSKQN
jgi:hypothetical protein